MTLPPTFCLYVRGRNPYSSHILIDATFDGVAWTLTRQPQSTDTWTINRSETDTPMCSTSLTVNVHSPSGVKGIDRCVVLSSQAEELFVTSATGIKLPVYMINGYTEIFGIKPPLRTNIAGPTYLASPPPPPPPPPPPSHVSPFIAKQLAEFAMSKHETCPITMEEFIPGEITVMPCGHLFSKIAIEETFKKEANKCPCCRQHGVPILV